MDQGLVNAGPLGYDNFEVTLGDQMRGERATMGKSLLDIQRDLRIKATYISAIENCDLSAFQAPSFIAGYVRSYARYLEMDPDECFVRFCEESGFGGVHSDIKSSSLAAKSAVTLKTPVPSRNTDPIAQSRFSRSSRYAEWTSNFSLSALGSAIVLAMLIVGLGYGSWTVLQEVQRVQFLPVNQTPVVTSDLIELSAETTGQSSTVVTIKQPPSIRTSDLVQLYRPEELEMPQMVARDAPISSIDAGRFGAYAHQQTSIPARVASSPLDESGSPRAVVKKPPPVDLVALKAAWVRVYFEDGSVLFEKILDAGESYRLPENVQNPLLRAGNAGSVFVKIGDIAHGPVGNPGGVVRGIDLNRESVTEALALAIDFVQPSSPPLNIEELNNIQNGNAIVNAGGN